MEGKGKKENERCRERERAKREEDECMFGVSCKKAVFPLLGSHELVVRRLPRMTTVRKVVAFRVKNLCFL